MKEKMKKQRVTKGLAVAALILNVLLPGLGSLSAGRVKTGITQLVFALLAIPLFFVFIGFTLFSAAWIWSIVTSIQILKEAK